MTATNTTINILAKIKGILNASTNLKYVYDYPNSTPQGYPSAVVFRSETQGSFADTSRDERHYLFDIRLMQERLEVGEQSAERILMQLEDELVAAFDADYNLTGSCNWCKPIAFKWGFIQAPSVDIRTAIITLDVIVVA
jgi:hypothetical protein